VKTRRTVNAGYNQLRWVVLLLAIAVILPTVCLLWFMSQGVRNVRLAVRQKLTDVYKQRLDRFSKKVDALWSARIDSVRARVTEYQPVEMFSMLTDRSGGVNDSALCDAVIIYDGSGKLLYPVAADSGRSDALPEEFNKAWAAEFIEKDFAGAVGLYGQIAESGVDDYVRYSALMGKVRCLRKSGQIEKAIALCDGMAYGQIPENISSSSVSVVAQARLLLAELKAEIEGGLGRSDVQGLIDSAVNYSPQSGSGFLAMPSESRIFFLRKALEIAKKSQWSEDLKSQVHKAGTLLSSEELAAAFLAKYSTGTASEPWPQADALKLVSLLRATLDRIEQVEWEWAGQLKQQIAAVLDSYQSRQAQANAVASVQPAFAALLESWPEDTFRRLDLPETAFAMYHRFGKTTCVFLQKAETLRSEFNSLGDEFEDLGVSYRITDNSGGYASGVQNPEQSAFLQTPLGRFFPGWYAAIHFTDVDLLEKAAERQRLVYVWAGLLVIAVMVAAGLLTAQAVGKQIKTNKLKNDFIATVSHELKTPLASMRVLVDTLLEGSYRNQQQVTEYLQLVSKENERLTGLIDNFLTFSRMERNKQAFAMARTSPGAMARDAAEAVKTKFSQGRCTFEVSIAENLPDVRADHDAMVTVLVNLLDNAYKYSYDDKRIELRVFPDNGSVCFCVRDNGKGISRRAAKKIFTRFYQVDRSLSRRAEGCGLGLSIAKFIVDAHKGTIAVNSKLGEGSLFAVRLPFGD
jgi:signal transduction histidine kinase